VGSTVKPCAFGAPLTRLWGLTAPPHAKQVGIHAVRAKRCRLAGSWFRPDPSMSVTSSFGLFTSR
jgi:hypothetical protein